jgi:hypothetical protein
MLLAHWVNGQIPEFARATIVTGQGVYYTQALTDTGT